MLRNVGRFAGVARRSYALVPPNGEYERQIWERLASKLSPTDLFVQDVSGGCGSMFAIKVVSPEFKGKPMVKQHRIVNEILASEIPKWHGLQLRTSSPKS